MGFEENVMPTIHHDHLPTNSMLYINVICIIKLYLAEKRKERNPAAIKKSPGQPKLPAYQTLEPVYRTQTEL